MANIQDNLQIKRYVPTLSSLFPSPLRNLNFHEKIRFLEMFFHGYVIYILKKGDKDIGYCVLARGGSFRYPFASRNDLIIGPYYIDPAERGKKYSIPLINYSLNDSYYKNSKTYYAFVQRNNFASIRILEECKFSIIGEAEYSKILRILKISFNGSNNYLIYRKLQS